MELNSSIAAVVTGGASGLGEATARALAAKGVKVALLDMEGTWLYKERPFDPKSKQETRPNSRVISVIFHTDDGNYLIRFSGPAATVNPHAKGFLDWIMRGARICRCSSRWSTSTARRRRCRPCPPPRCVRART